MATATETCAATEIAEPVIAAVEGGIRTVRRAAVAGCQAVEDRVDSVKLQVRRHPFPALGIAVGVGAIAGCLVGFAAGRRQAQRG